MDSVKYILGSPEMIDDIELYPVQLKNHDDFMNNANVLTVSYEYIDMDELRKEYGDLEIKLLDLLFSLYADDDQRELLINALIKIFSYVCRKNVEFDDETTSFIVEGCDFRIDKFNYDEIREIILRQNLIFTPKVYKSEIVQQWVDMAIKARARTSLKCTIEDMVTTIVALSGMDINVLKEYTIYQVKAVFNRVLKYEEYKTVTLFQTVDSSGKLHANHFAEEINMFKNPYDDVIKDKSSYKHVEDSISNKT